MVAFRRLSTLQYQGGDSVDYVAVKLEPLIDNQMMEFKIKVGCAVGIISLLY